MTGIEGDSIAKSARDRSRSGPGLPLLSAESNPLLPL